MSSEKQTSQLGREAQSRHTGKVRIQGSLVRDESPGTWTLSSVTHTHGAPQRQPLVPELVYFSTNTAKLGAQEILAHPGHLLMSSDSKEGHAHVYL